MASRRSLFVFFFISLLIPILFFNWLHIVEIATSSPLHEKLKFDPNDIEENEIRVFNIDINKERISDLKSRLALRKLPENSSSFMKDLTEVVVDFNWEQHQHFLNTFKQYKTTVEGLEIHFIRASIPPPKNSQVVPLLLLHGFPGSYWDFYKMIPFLSNPSRFAFDFGVKKPLLFDVIVPSLPGFIFSEKTENEDFSHVDIARILMKLMRQLGVDRYFIHGTEKLGSDVATVMASSDPTVWGVHLSNPFVDPFYNYKVTIQHLLNPSDYTNLYDYFKLPQFKEDATSEFMETALTDSPLALCAFIMDKWSSFSSSSKPLNELFTLDELATICHLYWLTDTLPTALRISRNSPSTKGFQVQVPTGIVQSADAPWRSPENVLRHQFTNITRLTRFEKGGLFTNLQLGEEIAADIFRFVEVTVL